MEKISPQEQSEKKNDLRSFLVGEGGKTMQARARESAGGNLRTERSEQLFYQDQVLNQVFDKLDDEWREKNADELPGEGQMTEEQSEARYNYIDQTEPSRIADIIAELRDSWEQFAEEEEDEEEKQSLYAYIDAATALESRFLSRGHN